MLLKALEAEVGGASVDPGTLFTDDVVGWSPYATVSGLTALGELAGLRDMAFSNVVLSFRGLDEVGNKAFAEWLIEADHTGPLVLGEEEVLEATGRHIQLPGATVADFRDGKIRSLLSSDCRANRPHLGLCPEANVPLQGRQGSRGCIPDVELKNHFVDDTLDSNRARHRGHLRVWRHLRNEPPRIKLMELIVANPAGEHRHVVDVCIFDH
ncbi:MAG TPA: nuclear transport factor 2 family protein, partial [Actinomycetes bacterium]|nr:nuclear transport factor 2 family protein [Actinomycetes bacterium]